MSVSRSREATIKRHTAAMARALIWLRNISPVCGAPRSPFPNLAPARIASGTRRSRLGARTTAESLTEIR